MPFTRARLVNNFKKKVTARVWSLSLVVLVGFEPTQTEPESGVLPSHHRTIFWNCGAKLLLFPEPPKLFRVFFEKSFLSILFSAFYFLLDGDCGGDELVVGHVVG